MTSQIEKVTLQRYRNQLVKERQRQRRAERDDKQLDFSSSDDDENEQPVREDMSDQIASLKRHIMSNFSTMQSRRLGANPHPSDVSVFVPQHD